MSTLTVKELLSSAVQNVNRQQRHFKINAKGHPKGSGLEVSVKTSKSNTPNTVVVWHTLEDGRRIRFEIEVVPANVQVLK